MCASLAPHRPLCCWRPSPGRSLSRRPTLTRWPRSRSQPRRLVRMLARAGARELTLYPVPTPCRSGRVAGQLVAVAAISRYPAGIAGYGPGWGAAPDWAGGRGQGAHSWNSVSIWAPPTPSISDVRHGIVLDQPSVMLLRRGGARRERVLAVGKDAAELLGRAPVRVRRGPTAARRCGHGPGDGPAVPARGAAEGGTAGVGRPGPRAVIGVPVGSTTLERRALLEAAEEAGIRPVTALDESIAGAVGCGIDPLERRVHMVVDVGGGTAEVAAFCFGGVLTHRTSKLAGDEMTLAVYRHLREQHQMLRRRARRGGREGSCRGGRRRPARCAGPRRRHRSAPVGDDVGRPRWPMRYGRSPTRSSGRSPHVWTTFPRRPSPTCCPRVCWCSAEARWSAASRRSWNGVSAFRSSWPRSH